MNFVKYILATIAIIFLMIASFNHVNASFSKWFSGFFQQDPVAGGTVCYPEDGCTGISDIPTYGQMLVGNAGGTYTLTATSSLGISGAGGDFAWTSTADGNATSTTIILNNGFISTASSTLSNDVNIIDFLNFTSSSTPSVPLSTDIRLSSYTDVDHIRLQTTDPHGTSLTITRDAAFIARNNTGVQIDKGSVVYISGQQGNSRPTIALADATDSAKMPAAGIAAEDIPDGADDTIIRDGILGGLDTSAFTAGDTLYVGTTTPGTLTNLKPVVPNLRQGMGLVFTSNAGNGKLNILTSSDYRDGQLSTGAIPFGDTTTLLQDASNFIWDDTNNRLGIGTSSPYAKLSVVGETVSEYFTATSTSATSTLPNISATQLLMSGDYITDFAGTGLSVTGGLLNWSASGIAGHDTFTDFVANEHIDWTGASAGTIHTDNYIENATHTGDVTGSGALTIANDKVLEVHLKAVDTASDEECLTYESTTGDFEWQACGGGSQTPWTSAIDGGGFDLSNVGLITASSFTATSTTATSTFKDIQLGDATDFGRKIRGYIDASTFVDLKPIFTDGSEIGWETNGLKITDGRFDFDPGGGKAEFRVSGGNTQFNIYNTGIGQYYMRMEADGANMGNVYLPQATAKFGIGTSTPYTQLSVAGDGGISGDLNVEGEIGGSRMYLHFQDSTARTSDTSMKNGSVTCNSNEGIVMNRSGSIVGIGFSFEATAYSVTGTHDVEIRKNNTIVYTGSVSVNATGFYEITDTQVRGTDTFVAGDQICARSNWNAGTYTVDDIQGYIEIVTDN